MKRNIDQEAVEEYLAKEYGYVPAQYMMRTTPYWDVIRIYRK